MPLEIQSALVKPNTFRNFTFQDSITQCLVGLSGYQLSYGEDTSHHLQTVSISLVSNHSGSPVLQVTPQATLFNGGDGDEDANLDPLNSWIAVTVIAWTGTLGSLTLTNANNIENNGSATKDIGCSNPSVLQAVLTGFNFSFGSDHHLVGYSCSAGASSTGGASAAIASLASMTVGSGEAPAIATIDAGLIANCDATYDPQLLPVQLQDAPQTLTFAKGTMRAFPFLTSVRASYFADHHVKTISAYLKISQNMAPSFTVTGGAYLLDHDGHTQNNSVSNVSGIVIGL